MWVTVDIREQIEDRLISQLKKRLTTVADRYFDDLDVIIGEIMEYNRENGYLPLLLISDGSSSFLYRVNNIAIELLTSGHNLSCDDCETVTRLYMYHFAGLSMLIRQMKKDAITYDKDFDKMTQKLGELLRPVVYNGIMPIIKKHIKEWSCFFSLLLIHQANSNAQDQTIEAVNEVQMAGFSPKMYKYTRLYIAFFSAV